MRSSLKFLISALKNIQVDFNKMNTFLEIKKKKLFTLKGWMEETFWDYKKFRSYEWSFFFILCKYTIEKAQFIKNQTLVTDSGINKSSNESSDRKKLLMSRQIALEKEKEDIKMADAFINNFRKQLKI